MADIDQWLAEASGLTAQKSSRHMVEGVEARLASDRSPQTLFARQDARRMMLCAGLAALFGFTATGVSGTFARTSPTWVAAPPASSPYGLLVGR